MRLFFYLAVLCVIGGLAWIRFAPSDPAYWNVDPHVTADQDLADGVRRRIPGGEAVFERLNGIILATPRTDVLAGSVADGQVTYVTRSKWMGFPDYTTVKLNGDVLELWARLRFGRSDMGVNRDRVEGWLAQLGAGRDS
ncbi:DUF1499 domain-containing protein [Sagittula stellata]|uniref:DUF1499 domain-containing protein n=1 Tax=Sagittula stellata (strain ATCC 700073 / DSM 11524 / E-37) TaxID=388399 RepID=A3JZ75_SAGS3|nr:DUF1499 domain-containing protein [Sagittula stellata]EBA09778.1 hypothetical protein SSE37_08218 [Sagittula stellata E-37]